MKLIRAILSFVCILAMLWIVFGTVWGASQDVGNAGSIVAFGGMAFLVGSMILLVINYVLGYWDE